MLWWLLLWAFWLKLSSSWLSTDIGPALDAVLEVVQLSVGGILAACRTFGFKDGSDTYWIVWVLGYGDQVAGCWRYGAVASVGFGLGVANI